MLKVAPTITGTTSFINEDIAFSFNDDADWRNAITNIVFVNTGVDWKNSFNLTIPGEISSINFAYNIPEVKVWVIKATGYADTVVTVTVQ